MCDETRVPTIVCSKCKREEPREFYNGTWSVPVGWVISVFNQPIPSEFHCRNCKTARIEGE